MHIKPIQIRQKVYKANAERKKASITNEEFMVEEAVDSVQSTEISPFSSISSALLSLQESRPRVDPTAQQTTTILDLLDQYKRDILLDQISADSLLMIQKDIIAAKNNSKEQGFLNILSEIEVLTAVALAKIRRHMK